MVDFDLKSYTELYFKNAQEKVTLIRSLINLNDADISTLHRICHSLKGQSFFMGHEEIGKKALELEKYFRSLLDNKQLIYQKKDNYVEDTLKDMEMLLVKQKLLIQSQNLV